MARLIDADRYAEVLARYINAPHVKVFGNSDGMQIAISTCAELLNAQRTVDAVPVVRCKDCRWARPKDHREPTDTPRELICQCFQHHYIPAPWGARMAVKPDNFCSYGERKDNG